MLPALQSWPSPKENVHSGCLCEFFQCVCECVNVRINTDIYIHVYIYIYIYILSLFIDSLPKISSNLITILFHSYLHQPFWFVCFKYHKTKVKFFDSLRLCFLAGLDLAGLSPTRIPQTHAINQDTWPGISSAPSGLCYKFWLRHWHMSTCYFQWHVCLFFVSFGPRPWIHLEKRHFQG